MPREPSEAVRWRAHSSIISRKGCEGFLLEEPTSGLISGVRVKMTSPFRAGPLPHTFVFQSANFHHQCCELKLEGY